jgi:hypothetical protein
MSHDFTALTGYNRKYSARILNAAPVKSKAA